MDFDNAFIEDVEAPIVCFIKFTGEELYFAVFKSDADIMIFTPVGKGYIVEES